MVFVDASALVAFLLQEPEGPELAERLQVVGGGYTSPLAMFETITAVMARRRIPRGEAEERLAVLLAEAGVTLVDITPEIGQLALVAFERYGKGRGHPAQLNMGDCFAYACAQSLAVPLLYKGDDFARTDLA